MHELTTDEIARLLRAAGAEIVAEVQALPDDVAAWHPAPGEWCVKECLGHIIEAERRGFAGRIRFLLEHEGDPVLTSWDQTVLARERNDCAAATARLLEEFVAERDTSTALVAALQPADLRRAGDHPQVGALSIAEIISEWVHHDRNHLKQMLTNVQEYTWSQMGSAQRFSLPH